MMRVALVCAMLAVASLSFAQGGGTTPSQNPTAAQPGAATAPPAAPQAPAKHPPQAKTQPEFDAYKAADANADPVALEKAADEFGTKFPDSELRILLYKKAIVSYQNANNADKMMDVARKALAIDPNDVQSLLGVAEVLVERTRDTDLDKDQRLDEAKKDAELALKSVDTETPAAVPPDKVDLYKGLMRSNAFSILGTLDFNRNNFSGAEANFRKSIDAFPQQLDPITVLRLALSLDRQSQYPEALTYANRAVELTQEGTQVGSMSRRERDRLVQLTGGKPAGSTGGTNPSQTPATPPKN